MSQNQTSRLARAIISGVLRWGFRVLLIVAAAGACRRSDRPPASPRGEPPAAPARPPRPAMPWDKGGPLAEGETFALLPDNARRMPLAEARAAGLLVFDLSDEWAPFIFGEGEPGEEPKPNAYRPTFVALANNRTTPDELFLASPEGQRAVLAAAGLPPLRKGQPPTRDHQRALRAAERALRGERTRNYLEVFGIPPTLSVLRQRMEEDRGRTCYEGIDREALAPFSESIVYGNRDQARRAYEQAVADAQWAELLFPAQAATETAGSSRAPPDAGTMWPTSTASLAASPSAAPDAGLSLDDPKVKERLERHRRGQQRLRVIRAVQARLLCEGLMTPGSRFKDGTFDLPTHEALALWERKNEIFGWGFIADETTVALQRPPREMHLDTFKRILAERVADAAGIIEDGSVSQGRRPAKYEHEGEVHLVPDLIGEHVSAVLSALAIETHQDLEEWLLGLPTEHLARFSIAIPPPRLPPYYGPQMQLFVAIDRGDVWYEFPWDERGRVREQRRQRYPHLTIFTIWNKQRIPLARWRTTIGSWRSEMGADGRVYYRYKNSDVGPRIWKNVVAAPVWIPPESTPAKDLLTRKVFDRNVGPATVVNTDVMGPGFQSAYGLVMAIHLKKVAGGGLFDNQIRTHGSVDYTSIARRFSHGCHRIVNDRAVRLFGFVLQRRPFKRIGNVPIGPMKRTFFVDDKEYGFRLETRGYYYELTPPIPVEVTEGRIKGEIQHAITAYIRKPGLDYGDAYESGIETVPELGP